MLDGRLLRLLSERDQQVSKDLCARTSECITYSVEQVVTFVELHTRTVDVKHA